MPCNLCGKWNCVCQYSQSKQQQEFTSGFFSREAMKEHSDFHPQPKAEQDKPAIDTTPQPKQEQQEPVAWMLNNAFYKVKQTKMNGSFWENQIPLYTHPQPKAEQDKPAIDTTPSQPAIDTTPQPKQEEQEPIAFVTGVFGGRFIVEPTNPAMVLPVNIALYTHPQPRKPLTDEQTIIDVLNKHFECVDDEYIKRAAKEIAAHGIKE